VSKASPRVVWWIDHLGHGGSQKSLVQIVGYVSEIVSLQAVIVLNNVVDALHLAELERMGVEVRVIGKGKLLTGLGMLEIWLWLRKKNFDISITFLFFSDIAGTLLSYTSGIKKLISSQRSSNKHYSYLQSVTLRAILKLTNVIVLNSGSYREEVQHYLPKQVGIEVIPNGIRIPEYIRKKNKIRDELSIDSSSILIGTVGRLSSEKGLEIIFKAFSQSKHKDAQLLITGSGPEKNRLENLAITLGIDDRIHMIGFRTDIWSILSSLDLYVHASIFEGMPISVLEAIAAGCPIVATDSGGIRELVTGPEHGWLVAQGDFVALVAAIDNALDCQEDARLRAFRALEHIKENYSDQHAMNNWQRLIQNAA
jgi:glycosyltransferase involved in cell wall biosynthesis